MLKTFDGVSFKRVGGKVGDKGPLLEGFTRPRATYIATGGETSIDLTTLNPIISYTPGQGQLEVKRSSGGGPLIAGLGLLELDSTHVGFPAGDALMPGEWVEITQNFTITGLMAASPRPDCWTETGKPGQTQVITDYFFPYNALPNKGRGAVDVQINGISQTRGIDYNEVQIGTTGLTNIIQFVDPLIGNENIAVVPQFAGFIDLTGAATTVNSQQIVGIQGALGASLAPFVYVAPIAVPYTTIVGRAPIGDCANNLKAFFGIERVMFDDELLLLQNEFGPSGESVYGINEDRVRFVGPWNTVLSGFGQNVYAANATNAYIEISFYGTGLNLLVSENSSDDLRIAIDGGLEQSTNYAMFNPSAFNGNLGLRTNTVLNLAKGLTQGYHTIKIRNNGSTGPAIYGCEVLNEVQQIVVNPGQAYAAGQGISILTQQSIAYNPASFTRGGSVLVYTDQSATIKTISQPVAAVSLSLNGADHSGEQVANAYQWREFTSMSGSSSTGFGGFANISSISGSVQSEYTLDDNATSLAVSSGFLVNTASTDCLGLTTSAVLTFSFIGCGLDVISVGGGDSHSVYVDGTLVGTINPTITSNPSPQQIKIASGLPFGQHVVEIVRNGTSQAIPFYGFTVYQPRVPNLPVGAVPLAQYNVLANYQASTANVFGVSQGVVRHHAMRDIFYSGSGWGYNGYSYTGGTNAEINQVGVTTSVSGDSARFWFYGTGCEVRYSTNSTRSSNISVTIDGLTPAGTISGGGSYSGGVLNQNASYGAASLRLTGLALGWHQLKMANNQANLFDLQAIDVITPIYAYANQGHIGFNNAQTVGSNSIGDQRITDPLNSATRKKSEIAVIGQGNPPSTSVNTYVALPDMLCGIYTDQGEIEIDFNGSFEFSGGAASGLEVGIYVDGKLIPNVLMTEEGTYSGWFKTLSGHWVVPVARGFHFVYVQWFVGTNGTVWNANDRRLYVKER